MAGQAAGAGLQAQAQVVPHRQLGNDLPPLGHIADPRPGPLVGRQGQQIPPSPDESGPSGERPGQASQTHKLAGEGCSQLGSAFAWGCVMANQQAREGILHVLTKEEYSIAHVTAMVV